MFRQTLISTLVLYILSVCIAAAQTPPSSAQIAAYTGLHAAAHSGNLDDIRQLVASGASLEAIDDNGRTPILTAAFASREDSVLLLAKLGANANALDNDRYDILTIAGVADDPDMVRAGIIAGCNPGNITSVYDGTALIASAHLGHVEVVRELVKAGAPLDHVNNLGWTALMEAVVLGDGGKDHTETVRVLVDGGADINIADRQAITPLGHATARGYGKIQEILRAAHR